MAKIKDLGINVIPMTMRPLEIGPGAGFDNADAPAALYLCGSASNCAFCAVCDGSVLPDTSCDPSPLPDCVPSCGPTDRPACPDASCDATPQPHKQHASGFREDEVMQLKQQLRTRIGKEIEN